MFLRNISIYKNHFLHSSLSLGVANFWTLPTGKNGQTRVDEIKNEMQKGYFRDLSDLKKTGGKHAIAEESLSPKKTAPLFPVLDLTSLEKRKNSSNQVLSGRVSLVLLCFRDHGHQMLKAYTDPLKNSTVQIIEICSLSGFYAYIGFLLESSLRQQIPQSQYSSFFMHYGTMSKEAQRILGIQNLAVGYAYLVDENAKIRWQAHAIPTQGELVSLKVGADQLLRELC